MICLFCKKEMPLFGEVLDDYSTWICQLCGVRIELDKQEIVYYSVCFERSTHLKGDLAYNVTGIYKKYPFRYFGEYTVKTKFIPISSLEELPKLFDRLKKLEIFI